ncbi:hypothetical protein BDR26DRAFT_189660 [Obelidium mucronatum]|nr:hypothetical protein BDR26DRAFT_189660 [Obelidium mucronatum]
MMPPVSVFSSDGELAYISPILDRRTNGSKRPSFFSSSKRGSVSSEVDSAPSMPPTGPAGSSSSSSAVLPDNSTGTVTTSDSGFERWKQAVGKFRSLTPVQTAAVTTTTVVPSEPTTTTLAAATATAVAPASRAITPINAVASSSVPEIVVAANESQRVVAPVVQNKSVLIENAFGDDDSEENLEELAAAVYAIGHIGIARTSRRETFVLIDSPYRSESFEDERSKVDEIRSEVPEKPDVQTTSVPTPVATPLMEENRSPVLTEGAALMKFKDSVAYKSQFLDVRNSSESFSFGGSDRLEVDFVGPRQPVAELATISTAAEEEEIPYIHQFVSRERSASTDPLDSAIPSSEIINLDSAVQPTLETIKQESIIAEEEFIGGAEPQQSVSHEDTVAVAVDATAVAEITIPTALIDVESPEYVRFESVADPVVAMQLEEAPAPAPAPAPSPASPPSLLQLETVEVTIPTTIQETESDACHVVVTAEKPVVAEVLVQSNDSPAAVPAVEEVNSIIKVVEEQAALHFLDHQKPPTEIAPEPSIKDNHEHVELKSAVTKEQESQETLGVTVEETVYIREMQIVVQENVTLQASNSNETEAKLVVTPKILEDSSHAVAEESVLENTAVQVKEGLLDQEQRVDVDNYDGASQLLLAVPMVDAVRSSAHVPEPAPESIHVRTTNVASDESPAQSIANMDAESNNNTVVISDNASETGPGTSLAAAFAAKVSRLIPSSSPIWQPHATEGISKPQNSNNTIIKTENNPTSTATISESTALNHEEAPTIDAGTDSNSIPAGTGVENTFEKSPAQINSIEVNSSARNVSSVAVPLSLNASSPSPSSQQYPGYPPKHHTDLPQQLYSGSHQYPGLPPGGIAGPPPQSYSGTPPVAAVAGGVQTQFPVPPPGGIAGPPPQHYLGTPPVATAVGVQAQYPVPPPGGIAGPPPQQYPGFPSIVATASGIQAQYPAPPPGGVAGPPPQTVYPPGTTPEQIALHQQQMAVYYQQIQFYSQFWQQNYPQTPGTAKRTHRLSSAASDAGSIYQASDTASIYGSEAAPVQQQPSEEWARVFAVRPTFKYQKRNAFTPKRTAEVNQHLSALRATLQKAALRPESRRNNKALFEFCRFCVQDTLVLEPAEREDLLDEAFDILKRQCFQGYADCQYLVGKGYLDDGNYESAYILLYNAAVQSHGQACCQLANLLAAGKGVEKDFGSAISFLNKGIRAGDVESAYRLGSAHAYGRLGLSVNFPEALRLLNECAKDSKSEFRPKGLFEISRIYELGAMNLQRNESIALSALNDSAKGGYLPAITKIAQCYLEGKFGLKADETKAISLYKTAAELGDESARIALQSLGKK